MSIRFRLSGAFLLLAFTIAPISMAAVPSVMNYQGRLTDNSPQQNPLNAIVQMTFQIYGSPSGSDLLWVENWPAVQVTNGIFNVLLGTRGSPIPSTVFTGGTVRLIEISVNQEVLVPRQRLGSVGFAFQADNAMKADTLGLVCAEGEVVRHIGNQWVCGEISVCQSGSSMDCYSGPAGTAGVGVCHSGTSSCNANGNGYDACANDNLPGSESCGNLLDDDCDGSTDEGCPCSPAAFINCEGVCFNPNSNLRHCGTCNNACAPLEYCNMGSCAPATIFGGVVTNNSDPSAPGPGIPSIWSFAGDTGVQAGDAMCAQIGANHACTYEETILADARGELASLEEGQTFWVHRVSQAVLVGGVLSAPGAGGRCNDWTYPTGHISDGEFGLKSQGALDFHFDQDTLFTGILQDGHAGTGPSDGGACGGVTRAILCCR